MAALLCVVALGCASGGVPRLGGDADVPDTNTGGKHDAPPFDARPPTDAAVDSMMQIDAMLPPDAGNPLFCTDNTQCTDQGTCCFIAACVPGTAVGNNLCFPQ